MSDLVPEGVILKKKKKKKKYARPLVEDDVGDALLVCEQLAEAGPEFEVISVRSLSAAEEALTSSTAGVLFDLGLPDAEGLDGLRMMITLVPGAAGVASTGHIDQSKGPEAVARRAEDDLVKGHVDREALARSVRYAIARRRSEEALRRLSEAEFLRSENTRARAATAAPTAHRHGSVARRTGYQPGGGRVCWVVISSMESKCPTGTVRVVVGDACGHGPDEAALGVALRVAWRALVLGGVVPDAIMPALERVLETERFDEQIFVTLCDLTLHPDLRQAQVRLAGHPYAAAPRRSLAEGHARARSWPSAWRGRRRTRKL